METRQATPSTHVASDPELSPAEELPWLYRQVLDRVALLEISGQRHDAGQIRLSATTVYSGAWNESGRHRLVALISRADRLMTNRDRTHGWTLRRRSVPAR